MRLIDADALMEYCSNQKTKTVSCNDIARFPTIDNFAEMKARCEELKAHIEYLREKNATMKGEMKALAFAVRCNGVSGNEVRYETD